MEAKTEYVKSFSIHIMGFDKGSPQGSDMQ
jgi:hypothetical protein